MIILGWDPMRSMKQHQLQMLNWWGNRIACATASDYCMRVNKTVLSLECCQGGSLLLKQFVWKVRSRWKQYCLRKQKRSTVQFSYDAQSYSQNFDSGRSLDDRPSPLAP